MIIDYTRIIIEPLCIAEYAAEIKKIIDTFLYRDGIARYGFEIGRVTARLGHSTPIGVPLNLFATRAEAEAYIHSIIADDETTPESPTEAAGNFDNGVTIDSLVHSFRGDADLEH